MAIPQGPNQRWSLDFVSDSLSCGRRFRILNVIDDFSRDVWLLWLIRLCLVIALRVNWIGSLRCVDTRAGWSVTMGPN